MAALTPKVLILAFVVFATLSLNVSISEGINIQCEFYYDSDPEFHPDYGDVCTGHGLGCYDCYCVLNPAQPYNCLP